MRSSRRRCFYSGSSLHVRNVLRSYDLHRSDITEFAQDDVKVGGTGGRYQTIYARHRDGRWIAISACNRSLVFDSNADDALDADLRHLRDWLDGSGG